MHPLVAVGILLVAGWIAVNVMAGMDAGSVYEDCLKEAAVDPDLRVADC